MKYLTLILAFFILYCDCKSDLIFEITYLIVIILSIKFAIDLIKCFKWIIKYYKK